MLRAIAAALRLDDVATAHLCRLGLPVLGGVAALTEVAPSCAG